MGAMTNEQYLAAGGLKCPYCGGENLKAGDISVDGSYAWQEVVCGQPQFDLPGCGKEWHDEYRLTGFVPVE